MEGKALVCAWGEFCVPEDMSLKVLICDLVMRLQVLWECHWQIEQTMGVVSQCIDLKQSEQVGPGLVRCPMSVEAVVRGVGQGLQFR